MEHTYINSIHTVMLENNFRLKEVYIHPIVDSRAFCYRKKRNEWIVIVAYDPYMKVSDNWIDGYRKNFSQIMRHTEERKNWTVQDFKQCH